jgi:hypothetical protein
MGSPLGNGAGNSPIRPPHSMGRIASAAIVLLMVGFAPMAYADTPDPVWIGGFWDGDGGDGAIALPTDADAASSRGTFVPLENRSGLVLDLDGASAGSGSKTFLPPQHRAPPDV